MSNPSTTVQAEARNPFPKPSWWRRLIGEARTRILLLHIVLMMLVAACSIPVFYWMVFATVDRRVRHNLDDEMEEFRALYHQWQAATPNPTVEDLIVFVEEFMASEIPEDDNFHIVLINGEFYLANPPRLPDPFRPGSPLIEQWRHVTRPVEDKQVFHDPDVGDVLYLVQPLVVRGKVEGVFATAHSTAGERKEAVTSVYIFAQIAIGIVMLAFLLAWFVTGQILKPIRSLVATARMISETDLKQRLPPVKGDSEMADLASTFNAMMDRIQAAFDTQRNFINDAGHELRTPITIIQGHLELMGDDPQDQEEAKAIVLDELERMARFVNDIILLAKSERPDFLQPETIDVSHFTEELFTKATALAPRNWQLVNQAKGTIVGDRQRLTGAVINLAQNASQHTQETDVIELGSKIVGKEVHFWVRDTGEGIAPSDQQRIFDRFARAANSYRRSEGAGLGLAIVRAIAEAHNGRVELVSQPGVGSTFTLILPIDSPLEKPRIT